MKLIHRKDLSKNGMFVIEVESCFEDMIQYRNTDLLNIKYIFFDENVCFKDWFSKDLQALKIGYICYKASIGREKLESISLNKKNDIVSEAANMFVENRKNIFYKNLFKMKYLQFRIVKYEKYGNSELYYSCLYDDSTDKELFKINKDENVLKDIIDSNGYELLNERKQKCPSNNYFEYIYDIKKKPKGKLIVDSI